MKKAILYLAIISLGISFLASCEKEPESDGNLQPITFKSPASNPANVQRGASINYEIEFETANLIDSVMVRAYLDTTGKGYEASRDTIEIFKKVYPLNDQNNIQSISGTYPLDTFAKIGDKLYMTATMRAKEPLKSKRLTLHVL